MLIEKIVIRNTVNLACVETEKFFGKKFHPVVFLYFVVVDTYFLLSIVGIRIVFCKVEKSADNYYIQSDNFCLSNSVKFSGAPSSFFAVWEIKSLYPVM